MISQTSCTSSSSKGDSSEALMIHHLGAAVLAKGNHPCGAKAQQSILVGHHQTADLAGTNATDKGSQALLVVIQSRAEILQCLKGPAVGCTEGFKQRNLPDQIPLLVVAGNPGIGESNPGRGGLARSQSTQLGKILQPPPRGGTLHLDLSCFFPAPQGFGMHSQFPGRLANTH